MGLAALVLCGGESRRMGRSKAWLRLGSETLLERVAGRLGAVASPVVVVAAEAQELPQLPGGLGVARDRFPSRGPLEALRTGLEALEGSAEWAYVTGTDSPFVNPEWVRRLREWGEDYDLVLPVDGDRMHPLAALYRIVPARRAAEAMLGEGKRRLSELAGRLDTLRVGVEAMREVDPALETLRNLNTPEDYGQALRDLGLSANSFGLYEGS